MAVIKGTKGTNGTSGASPTAGGKGQDETFTQNGKIGQDSITAAYAGGDGGDGGNGAAVPGANGGLGGNASITFNGNILNAPASTAVLVSLSATGGDGGLAGTGTPNGTAGKGGNGSVTASGNIFQPNKILTSIELDAFAAGGNGSTSGNATSVINGNIVQSSKALGTVTLDASALGGGTNAATLNGNIVQGNVNNVALAADTNKGTASVNGNIVQTNATNTGFVTLEASGSHIAITNNKFTLGLQELDWTINATSPYDVTVTGNTLKGTGANAFHFTDNDVPGPVTDSVSINLASQVMTFDGQATNAITGFSTLVGGGNAIYTLTGDDNANTLTGGGLNDTFTGGKGNDTINGGAGTDTAIYSGNFAQYTIAVNALGNGTITDTVAGRDGTDTLTSIEKLQFADGTYNTGTGLFTGPNHAPVLDASKSPMLANEPVNSPAPVGAVGTLVSALVDPTTPAGGLDNVTDADAGALLGIALTGTDVANGTWFYSTNNGTTWTAVPAVTDSSALLLAADGSTRLYFQPTAAYTGTDAGAITFRAWDQTSGVNGQSGVNVSGANNGGTTAFSTASDTASLTVATAMNAPPTATNLNAPETYIEDNALNLTDIVVSDVDSPNVTATLTLSAPAAGALTTATSGAVTSTYNAVTGVWTASGAIGDVNTLLAGVSLVPSNNYNGSFTIGTKVDDGSGNIITGTKAITGTPVNDAPVGTSNTFTILEDSSRTFAAADFGFSDPTDAASASGGNNFANVIITALPAAGSLTYNNVAVTANQSIAVANLGLLKFTPAANANGTGYASFGFEVQDDGGTANGGIDTSAAKTITFNVTSVNDAPAGTDNTITTFEDTTYTLAAGDFGFTDPNDTPANALLAVKITTVPTSGVLKDGATVLVAGSVVSATDITNNMLTFTPAANASGPASFTFQVQDDGGVANGGQDTDQSPNTITFNVYPVNDAPVGTSGSVTTLEDTAYTFSAANFGFTDPNDTPANALKAVEITTLPAAGTLTDNGVAVTAGQFVSVADINANKLVFTPAANANGAGYASFTFQVQDDGGTSHGGVDTDTTAKTLTINVTPVNDAPVANNDSYSTDLGTALVVSAGAGVLANDTDVDSPSLTAVNYTNPTHGTLAHNTDGSFTYTPTAGYSGADSFTYQANDGSLNSNVATVNITVNPGSTFTGPGALAGGNGDDTFIPVAGTTSIDGMGNSPTIGDTVVFSNATSGVNANVAGTQDFSGSGLNAALTLTNIENLTGSGYDDVLTGADGIRNTLSGGAGDDTLVATSGDGVNGDTLDGGTGNNTADFSLNGGPGGVTVDLGIVGPQNVMGTIGPITLTNIQNLTGSAYDDTLIGNSGDNVIDGGAGGTDTVSYANGTSNGLVVNLITGSSSGGGNGNDTLYNIQNVLGSPYNDILIGNGINTLDGGAGTDIAYFSGLETDYAVSGLASVVGGPDNVVDTLSNVERVKFLAPSHVSDVYDNGFGDLVSQNSATGQVAVNGTPLVLATPLTGTQKVVGTGQFDPDEAAPPQGTARNSGILVQDNVTGVLTVLYDINGAAASSINFSSGGALISAPGPTNNYGANWKAIATGDFNGDASADVLLQNQATKALEIFTVKANAGDAVGFVDSVSTITGPAGTAWKPIATGDFNGDGRSDILFQNTMSKSVEIYEMNGATTINNPAAQTTSNLTAIGTGDFNDDGNSDILFTNATGQAVIWFMNGDSHVGTKTVAKPAGYTLSGALDIDGNGYSDLIWTNGTSTEATTFSTPSSMVSATATMPTTSNALLPGFGLVASTGGG